MKKKKITLIKLLGLAMAAGGTLVASWVSQKENEEILENLVNEKLNPQIQNEKES